MTATGVSRRGFVLGAAAAALATSAACSRKSQVPANPDASAENAAPGPWTPFPIVQVHGGPAELGEAIGAATRARLETCLQRRRAWFEDLKAFALAERATRLDAFMRAAEARHPDIMAELRGMARGCGRELDDLLVLNFHPELAAMKAQSSCGDCSTLHLVRGGSIVLAHNEDDDDAYRDQMVVLKCSPRGKPGFVSLAYPGALTGNVPGMNDAGMVRTTNFIGAKEVRPGVPRYVIGRAVLSAATLEEALRIATTKDGAYAFHLSLGSTREKRLLSLEVGPGGASDRHESSEEVYLHTNHFVLPAMRDVRQQDYPSSQSRYEVLRNQLGELGSAEALVRALSSHASTTRPYSPCRHPEGAVRGRTVALALFDITAGKFSLYEGNPCEGRRRELV